MNVMLKNSIIHKKTRINIAGVQFCCLLAHSACCCFGANNAAFSRLEAVDIF